MSADACLKPKSPFYLIKKIRINHFMTDSLVVSYCKLMTDSNTYEDVNSSSSHPDKDKKMMTGEMERRGKKKEEESS